MDVRRRLLVIGAALGGVALVVWVLASADAPPPYKIVDVRVQADDDVCWQVEDGPKDPFNRTPEQFRCGSSSVGYDDDYVAVPSSVVVRKTQDNDAEIRATFWVNGEMTDSGETDDPGGAIVLSGA
jgi:hypothetical protein